MLLYNFKNLINKFFLAERWPGEKETEKKPAKGRLKN
jgi:hypothetical protein